MVSPSFSIDAPSPPPPFAENHPTGKVFFAGDLESSSSIGSPDDSDIENDVVSLKRKRDEDGEEVESKFKGLNSLDSLEDSLPIKKGLSNHYTGKSRSFLDMSQVTTVEELKKQEHPFNKRRRLLISSKLSRKSIHSCFNPKPMPPFTVDEDDENQGVDKEVTTKGSPSSSSSIEEKKNPQQP